MWATVGDMATAPGQNSSGGMVTFPSNGHHCEGYLVGSGPGVIVVQEWWGLVPHIRDVAGRFAGGHQARLIDGRQPFVV